MSQPTSPPTAAFQVATILASMSQSQTPSDEQTTPTSLTSLTSQTNVQVTEENDHTTNEGLTSPTSQTSQTNGRVTHSENDHITPKEGPTASPSRTTPNRAGRVGRTNRRRAATISARQSKNGGVDWSQDDEALLWRSRLLVETPEPYKKIGKELGRSEQACRLKMHQMNKKSYLQYRKPSQPQAVGYAPFRYAYEQVDVWARRDQDRPATAPPLPVTFLQYSSQGWVANPVQVAGHMPPPPNFGFRQAPQQATMVYYTPRPTYPGYRQILQAPAPVENSPDSEETLSQSPEKRLAVRNLVNNPEEDPAQPSQHR